MPKVTSLSSSSEAGASASTSRAGRNANPFHPVDPNSYNDYDQAMQDGVELEEKGERFQFGPKAQRFYFQAGMLYARAAQLAAGNSQRRADALYNTSRIHFLLASQFALPPDNLHSFVQAIATAQEAVRLAPPLSAADPVDASLPNPFTLDTMMHLATSLQTLAEAIQELGWPQGLQRPTLATQRSDQTTSPTLLWQEALAIFQQVADAQNIILHDQRVSDSADGQPTETPPEPSNEVQIEESESQSASGADDVYGYTSSLVTPESLMGTLLSMLACLTSLIEAASTLEAIQAYSAAVDQIVSKAEALASETSSTVDLPTTGNDAPSAAAELAASWDEVRRSALAIRIARLDKAIDLGPQSCGINGELELVMQTVSDWGARLTALPAAAAPAGGRRDALVAALCDVGEAGQNLCRLSLRLQPAETGVAAIWTLATSSTKLFSQALGALDTSRAGGGSAAVLGQANTSTPTSRARCRILLALSSLSILRSHPAFEAAGIAGAKGTRTKLVDNARLYARKAVTEIGLGWLLRPAPAQAARSAAIPPPGGWESLCLEAEATFHLLRALLVRSNVHTAVDPKPAAEFHAELQHLCQHIIQLRHRPIQIGPSPSSASTQLADWLYKQGAQSFVDTIVDDHGRNIVHEEIGSWERLFSEQLAL